MATANFGYFRILGANEALMGENGNGLGAAAYLVYHDKVAQIVIDGAKMRMSTFPETLAEIANGGGK